MRVKWAKKEQFKEYAEALGIDSDQIAAVQQDPADPGWAWVLFTRKDDPDYLYNSILHLIDGEWQPVLHNEVGSFNALVQQYEQMEKK